MVEREKRLLTGVSSDLYPHVCAPPLTYKIHILFYLLKKAFICSKESMSFDAEQNPQISQLLSILSKRAYQAQFSLEYFSTLVIQNPRSRFFICTHTHMQTIIVPYLLNKKTTSVSLHKGSDNLRTFHVTFASFASTKCA